MIQKDGCGSTTFKSKETGYEAPTRKTWKGVRDQFERNVLPTKAALRKSYTWGFLPKIPDFEFLKEPEKLIEYICPEQFQKLYQATERMIRPKGFAFTAQEWWQGILCFGFMTGWRVSEMLALDWDDVDLDERTSITRWQDNKGKRDGIVDLHPVVVEHLRSLVGFNRKAFPWPHHERTLWSDFERLKDAAGVEMTGAFHRLRHGFATANQGSYDLKVLQSMMRHKSSQTTQRYMNIETWVRRTSKDLFVPSVLYEVAGS